MILIDLSPTRLERARVRARRAAMTPEQRREYNRRAALSLRERRESHGDLVREQERQRYASNDGRRAQMKAAVWRHKLKTFGLTEAEYHQLSEKQGNRCACCGTDTPGRRQRVWCVDHDHRTGRVRGLVCHRCNVGIGMLGDNVDGVARALAYLKGAV